MINQFRQNINQQKKKRLRRWQTTNSLFHLKMNISDKPKFSHAKIKDEQNLKIIVFVIK